MYLLKKRRLFLFVIFSLSGLFTYPQDMNSPYSIYGIGNIDMQQHNLNAGMGYTGIGLKSTYFSSGNNAASISGLPLRVIVGDINAVGQISTYHGTPINMGNSTNRDFTIKSFLIANRINKTWASAVGFRQFSTVNYQFTARNYVQGSNNVGYTSDFNGSGGLNQYFWNNAFNIGNHLAAGINASLVSGPISQTESFTAYSMDIESSRRDYYGNFRFEYGLIYNTNPKNNHVISVGINYAPQSKLNYERSISLSNGDTKVIDGQYLGLYKFNLPSSYGAGFAVTNSQGVTFGADYSFQQWSRLNYKGSAWQLVDANRISAGAEFAKIGQRSGQLVYLRSFQIGGYYSNSYLRLNGEQINEFGVTAGMKFPVKSSLLVNTTLEAGSRGTVKNGLIQEIFVKLSISFSLRELIYGQLKN